MIREKHVHHHGVEQHDGTDAECTENEAPLDWMYAWE